MKRHVITRKELIQLLRRKSILLEFNDGNKAVILLEDIGLEKIINITKIIIEGGYVE